MCRTNKIENKQHRNKRRKFDKWVNTERKTGKQIHTRSMLSTKFNSEPKKRGRTHLKNNTVLLYLFI